MFAFVGKNDYPLSWVVFNRVDISNKIKHQTEVWLSPHMTNVFFGLQVLSVTSQGTSRVFLGNLQTSYCLLIFGFFGGLVPCLREKVYCFRFTSVSYSRESWPVFFQG